MRSRLPAFLTLPSSTEPTSSSEPIWETDFDPDLYWLTEVRAMTRSSRILERLLINSSVRPSAKYSSLGSGLMFARGSTARRARGPPREGTSGPLPGSVTR